MPALNSCVTQIRSVLDLLVELKEVLGSKYHEETDTTTILTITLHMTTLFIMTPLITPNATYIDNTYSI
jgi:hypothetical protein